MSFKKHCKLVLFFLGGIFMSLPQMTFAEVLKSNEAWAVLTLMGKKDNWLSMIEPQYRVMSGDTSVNNQTLFNAGGGYQVSSQWQLWLGGTWSTTAQDTLNASHYEARTWQQTVWTDKFSANTLIMRTRLEERKSMDYEDWSYRLRERAQFNVPITAPYYLVFMDEFFINLNSVEWVTTGTIDQNRAYAGIARQFTPSILAGIGYLNQYIYTSPAQLDNVLLLNMQINF